MFKDLRTQLLLWMVLPLAAILLIVAYLGVNSHQTAMREMVAERDGAIARVAATQWSDMLVMHAQLVPTLDPAHCDASCTEFFDGGIALFDARGTLLSAHPAREIWSSRRTQVSALINVQDITFSAPFVENGILRVLVATPKEGNVIIGAFMLPSLTYPHLGTHSVAYLVDGHGKIIAHPDAGRVGEDLSQHAGIPQVLRGEVGATFHHASDGAELVAGYAPITRTGWGLIVEESWEHVITPMFQYTVLLPLALALSAVVALGAVYFGLRNVIRPLHSLAQAARRIADGDYHAAENQVGGAREIEELRETLNSMAQQVSVAQNAMQNYITAMTRGQEDERLRLARELHDDTIQSLIALQQRVEMTQKAMAKNPALATARLNELKTLLTDTLTSVRRFVGDLRPTYLGELGLIPALEMLTRQANARFEVVGEEMRLDVERELALYRIAQEALRNVAKHAQAQNVSVTLSFDEHAVAATIQDDGVGFDSPDAPTAYTHAGHFGLMGMQERAQLFGGNVYVKSELGKGTKIVARVPVAMP